MAAMVRCVRDQGGIVNKFMGDAVMAVFGVPSPRSSDQEVDADAAAAVACALAMERELQLLNRPGEGRCLPFIGMSVGLQTGQSMAGPFGRADPRGDKVIGEAGTMTPR